MKVGTDLDESLYDPNEVVLNAKKFDSLFQNFKFSSIDDIDKIAENTSEEESNIKTKSKSRDASENEEKKSYTNTVNSKEFREYLKKKGLVLFPTKSNGNSQTTKHNILNNKSTSFESKIPVKTYDDATDGDRKKTVFRRLSSIFSKKKTTPKTDVTPVLSFTGKKDEKNGSAMKRVMLERTRPVSEDNSPILANNEFLTSKNFLGNKSVGARLSQRKEIDNEPRPIDDKNVGVPLQLKSQNKLGNASTYRNIDLKRSKLYQTTSEPCRERNIDDHSSYDLPKLSNNVIKPRPYSNSKNAPIANYSTSSTNSNNYHENYFEKNPIKTQDMVSRLPPQNAPINEVKHSPIDPFMFAKIHEIKRKTDEVLLNKSLSDENKEKANNQNFVRNSQQRSTISEGYEKNTYNRYPQVPNPRRTLALQPPQRSQSVLDNMTCYDNSLYGEVTYRQPNSTQDVNVIMRRPSTTTLDKKQIMDKIYDYYRKSIDNSPVYFERKNYQWKSSHSPKVPPQKFIDNSIGQNLSTVPQLSSSRMPQNSFRSLANRSRISESDSEFATETASLDNYPHYFIPNRGVSSTPVRVGNYPIQPQEEQRIYDVVDQSPRNQFNNKLEHSQRTPISRDSLPLLSRGDIIYNNQIYRPISAIVREVSMSPKSPSLGLYANRSSYRGDLNYKPPTARKPDIRALGCSGSNTGDFKTHVPNQYSGK